MKELEKNLQEKIMIIINYWEKNTKKILEKIKEKMSEIMKKYIAKSTAGWLVGKLIFFKLENDFYL